MSAKDARNRPTMGNMLWDLDYTSKDPAKHREERNFEDSTANVSPTTYILLNVECFPSVNSAVKTDDIGL